MFKLVVKLVFYNLFDLEDSNLMSSVCFKFQNIGRFSCRNHPMALFKNCNKRWKCRDLIVVESHNDTCNEVAGGNERIMVDCCPCLFSSKTPLISLLSLDTHLFCARFSPFSERKEILDGMKLACLGHRSFRPLVIPSLPGQGYFYRKCGHWQEEEKLNTNL